MALNINQFQSQFFEQIDFMNTGSVQRPMCTHQYDGPTEYCTQWTDQRECMGILEHQTMPSLHDIANAQNAHIQWFCVILEVRLSLHRSQLFWLYVHLAYVNLCTVLSCPVWLGPSTLWTIQCILYSGTWGNFHLLLYSKWTQLSVVSYAMKGRHGLVL